MTLEQSLSNAWNKVNNTFCYPNLPYPEIIADEDEFQSNHSVPTETAGINMHNHKIYVNKKFVDYLAKRKLSQEHALSGLLHHEVNHYMYCPYDLAMFLRLNNAVAEVSPTHANEISNYFQDAVINLDLLIHKKDTDIDKVYRSMEKKHNVDKIMAGLYQKRAGIKMKVRIKNRLRQKVQELDKLDYFDKNNWVETSKDFARILHRMFRDDAKNLLMPIGVFDANAYSNSEIETAIRKIVPELSPEEFKGLIERTGIRVDFLGGELDKEGTLDIIYYEQLAKKYSLAIRGKPVSNSGSPESYEHKKWEIGEPIDSIDPFNSYGRFIPGLTQSWKQEPGVVQGIKKDIPNLVLAIDSSASMKNPAVDTSPAVLGACVAADSYLSNNAQVATYNFSESGLITEFSTDRKKIFANLIAYQSSGTVFDVSILNNIVKKSKRPVDIMVISDMEISNKDELMNFLTKIENKNRITMVYITNQSGQGTSVEKDELKGLTTYYVSTAEDIPKIVVGEVSKSIN